MSGFAARAGAFGVALLAIELVAPGWARAVEEAHAEHGPSVGLLALQALNALLLVGLLARFLRRPLQEFMVQRRDRIQTEIRAAEQRIKDAETELARWRSQLEAFQDESERLRDQAVTLGEVEREQARERAAQSARRIARDARRVADQEIERARLALRIEAATLASEIARDLVQRSLTQEDDRRLVGESIDRIGGIAR